MKKLRAAAHEVAWGVEEEVRVMLEKNLLQAPDLGAAVERALVQRREALIAYRRHVTEHGCLAEIETHHGGSAH